MSGSCCESCTDCAMLEFRAENVGLYHDNPSVFVVTQWPFSQKVFVAYRLLVALGFMTWLAADSIYETRNFFRDHTYNYMIYATNWSFVLLTLTAIYNATCALYYTVRSGESLDRQTFERMPPALKGLWLLQNLSYNSAIVVTASFWSYIAVLDRSAITQDKVLTQIMKTHMSQMKHTLNTVYVVLDIMISATPYRILHLLYTVVLGSIYSLFNAMYFLNDGTILEGRHYAYNLLNWSKPSEAIVTCVLCIVMCIFAQILLYELYKIRTIIFRRIFFGPAEVERSDSDMHSEMTKIMADAEAPAYHTIGESECQSQEYVAEQ